MTAAKELIAEEIVESEPLNSPAINKPVIPGRCWNVSATKSGSN